MQDTTSYQTRLQDFGAKILVVCPRCKECALLLRIEARGGEVSGNEAPGDRGNRLVCSHCGHSRDWRVRRRDRVAYPGGGPHLVYGLETWLQIRCGGEVLWAYNPEHLDYLERYLASNLRSRSRDPEWGWSNQSLESRLPRWMKAGKNREVLLRKLEELQRRVPERFRSSTDDP